MGRIVNSVFFEVFIMVTKTAGVLVWSKYDECGLVFWRN